MRGDGFLAHRPSLPTEHSPMNGSIPILAADNDSKTLQDNRDAERLAAQRHCPLQC